MNTPTVPHATAKSSSTYTQISTNAGKGFSMNGITLPKIWDRDFALKICGIGRSYKEFIHLPRELKIELGSAYEVMNAIVELSRRFGNGFHFSNQEVLEHMGNTISEAKLYRDKKKLTAMGVLHCHGGVKNRTHYYLHNEWFNALICRLLSKLGILQRHNDGSHIISNESSELHDHNDPAKACEDKPRATGLLTQLVALGMYWGVARKLIQKAGEARVTQELNYVLQIRKITDKGAYLRQIIENLDKRKETQRQSVKESKYSTPGLMATEIYLREREVGPANPQTAKTAMMEAKEALRRALKK